MKTRVSLAALAAVAILTAVAAAGFAGAGTRAAPAVELLLLDGQKLRLESLRGAPVLVTFWATTCKGCREEIPHLVALQREFGPRGLRLLAVAMAYDPPAQVLEFTRREQLPYTVVLDLDGAVARAFDDVSATPTTVVIDSRGRIVFRQVGVFDPQDMRARISGLLAVQPA